MQSFNVLSPASQPTTTRDNPVSFAGEKPAHNSEKFGDVMDRALNAPHDGRANDKGTKAFDKAPADATANPATPAPTQQPKDAGKTKKAHRHESKKDSAETQATKENPTTSAQQPVEKTIPDQIPQADKGTSDGEMSAQPDPGTGHPVPIANGENTQVPAIVQFLTISNIPIAVPSPSIGARGQTKSGRSGEAKGNSGPVASTSEKPANAGSTLADILGPKESAAPTASKSADTTDQKPEAKAAKTDEATDNSKVAPLANEAAAPDKAMQLLQPHLDKAEDAQTPAIPVPIPSSPEISKAKTSAPTSSIPPLQNLSGTSAAKEDITMKKAEKTTKVAGQAEQDLPGNTSSASTEMPAAPKSSGNSTSEVHGKLDTLTGIELLPTKVVTSAEIVTPTATTVSVAPSTTVDSRVLERTHDIVALHAMRLREAGSNSLHVVVKPGGGIQLSLELRQNETGIEVHASLHKGDFEHLSQYWPELQQRMETRGVRVGSLTCTENFSGAHQQNSQQSKQQTANHDPLHAGAFAEFALAGSLSEAPATRAARASAYRGWETWA